jgi:hypothetical protein
MRQYWARLENKWLGLTVLVVCVVAEFLIWTNPLGSARSHIGIISQAVTLFGFSFWRLWKKRQRQVPIP